MPVLYNPGSLEWSNLLLVLTGGLISGAFFAVSAAAANWTVWWKKLHEPAPQQQVPQQQQQGFDQYGRPIVYAPPPRPRIHGIIPRFFHPYMYAGTRLLMGLLSAFAFWWAWRQGFRSEFTPAYAKAPKVVVNEDYFFVANLFYVLFYAFTIFSPLCTFHLGLPHKWTRATCFVEFVAFGLSVVCTIYFWLIIPLAGILNLIVSVWYLYSVYVLWSLGRNSTRGLLRDMSLYMMGVAERPMEPFMEQPQAPVQQQQQAPVYGANQYNNDYR